MDQPRLPEDRRKALAAAVIYVVMIFGFATLPGAGSRHDHGFPLRLMQIVQNALHIPLYGGLAWLLLRASHDGAGRLPGAAGVAVVLIALAVAVADEWIQSRAPGRTASVLDVGLDLVGTLAVTIGVRVSERHRP